jgi:hypothetical protein
MAGIVDGEGSICLFAYWHKNSKASDPRGYRRMKPLLAVTNTNKALLEWIAETFGGTVQVVKRRKEQSPKWKQCFVWTATHRRAADILELIRPYLIAKREQADLFLEFIKTAKHYGPNGVPLEIAEQRERMYKQMVQLNRRGPDALDSSRSTQIH